SENIKRGSIDRENRIVEITTLGANPNAVPVKIIGSVDRAVAKRDRSQQVIRAAIADKSCSSVNVRSPITARVCINTYAATSSDIGGCKRSPVDNNNVLA